MLGDHIFQHHIAAGRSNGSQIGPRFDLIRNNGIKTAVQLLNAVYPDDAGTCAAHVAPHGVEEVGQVYDMGFPGGIFDDGPAFSQNRSQHDIHGGTDADHIQINICTMQLAVFRLGIDIPIRYFHFSPHGPHSLQMLVNGTDPKIAAARHRNLCFSKTAEKYTDEIIGCTDLAHGFASLLHGGKIAAVKLHRCPVDRSDRRAHLIHIGQHQAHIADLRDIFYSANTVHQHGCGNNRNGSVLRAADLQFAMQRFPAADLNLSCHGSTSL